MKLFKEGKFNDAKKNLEIALKTTRDKKGKTVLQLELDKVTLTSMHINIRIFNINYIYLFSMEMIKVIT